MGRTVLPRGWLIEGKGIAQQYKGYPTNRLSRNLLRDDVANHPWSRLGSEARGQAAISRSGRVYRFSATVGMFGYYAGPNVIILDELALADPLLARLPTANRKAWRIGHFLRRIPNGYAMARFTGNLRYMDPGLAKYYEKIRFITRGPLWSWQRITAILAFNLGRYEVHRREYLERGG
jgi:arabinofuranosyltransferase